MDSQQRTNAAKLKAIALISKAWSYLPETVVPDLVSNSISQEFTGVSPWHHFEGAIWEIGEEIRLLMNKEKSLRRDLAILSSIAALATDRRAKRGRQSFILLLGSVHGACFGDQIASQLDDVDVVGQVINTLLKMRRGEFVEQVHLYRQSEVTWIRNEAKRYCERFGGAGEGSGTVQ